MPALQDWTTAAEVEAPAPLPGAASIDLGEAVGYDAALRVRFAPAAATDGVTHRRWRDVDLFPGLALPFKDGQAIAEARYCIFGDEEAQARAALERPGRRLDAIRCFLGFNRVHTNHHHIVTQIVPAVAGYAADPGFRDGMLLLPEGASHLTRAFAAAGLALPDIAWVSPRFGLAVGDLTWSSQLAGAPGPSCAEMFARMRRAGPAAGGSPARIYVWRLDSSTRPMLNEDALVAMLAGYGVVPVVPSQLGLAQQVALFRAARLVVGAHGAGLSNVGFCAPGALLYELFPSHYVNPCMFRLAELGGLHYACDAHPADPAPGQWRHQVPWSVDVDAVERRLCALLARPEIAADSPVEGIELAAASL